MPYEEFMDPTPYISDLPVAECCSCGRSLFKDEICFHLMGEVFCIECIKNAQERV